MEKLDFYIPIENFFKGDEILSNQMVNIQAWRFFRDIPSSETIYNRWNILSSLIGSKPLKYVDYEYRNAVWSTELDGFDFLFLYSKRGIELSVEPNSSLEKIRKIMSSLEKLMIGNSQKTIF